MVFLLTDANEYRELRCPSTVTIGRGNENHFRPESQSVSKVHATLSITPVNGTNRVDVWLEDLNSRNGTYAGNTPLDLERVKARVKLYDGDYIRFGHSQKYFRYMVNIPVDAEIVASPEVLISPSKDFQNQLSQYMNPNVRLPQSSQSMKQFFSDSSYAGNHNNNNNASPPRNRSNAPNASLFEPNNNNSDRNSNNNYNNNNLNASGRDAFQPQRQDYNPQLSSNQPITNKEATMNRMTSAETIDNMLQPYMPSNEIMPSTNRLAVSGNLGIADRLPLAASSEKIRRSRYADNEDEEPEPLRARSQGSARSDPKNMTISINYPTNTRTQHPVSITIDPTNEKNKPPAPSKSRKAWEEDSIDNDSYEVKQSQRRSRKPLPEEEEEEEESVEEPSYRERKRGGSKSPTRGRRKRDEEEDSGYASPKVATQKYRASRGEKYNSPPKPEHPVYPTNEELTSKMFAKPQIVPPRRNPFANRDNSELFRASDEPDPITKFMTMLGAKKGININGGAAAIVPVRRSWPEGFYPPSSEIIARFCDLIVGDEVGSTYKNFYTKEDPTVTSKDKRVPLKKQKTKNLLPPSIPNVIISEVIAENLSISRSGVNAKLSTVSLLNSAIKELNDLLKQSLQGSQIEDAHSLGGADKTAADFDHVLHGVVGLVIQSIHSNVSQVAQCNLVKALAEANKSGTCPNIIATYLQESQDTLVRLNGFVMGSYLSDEIKFLKSEQIYEVLSHCISNILNKLDACNVAIHIIYQQAEDETNQHVNAHGGVGGKTTLSVELEQLRQLKKETENGPWLDRIRQQESSILEKKMSRFHRVFELAEEFQLKCAISKWRMISNGVRRHGLRLLDIADKHVLKNTKLKFEKWKKVVRIQKQQSKALHRFSRIIGWKGLEQIRRRFRVWANITQKHLATSLSAAETARLKLEICNLKAKVHDVTSKNDIAANLAAERALNRELSSMNLELRNSLQNMENKLLECAGAPQTKRRDLVYQFLIGKEEEVAQSKRESAFLLSELELLTMINEAHRKAVGGNVVPGRSSPQKSSVQQSTSVPNRNNVNSSNGTTGYSKVEEFKRNQLSKNNYNAIPATSGGSVVMTKDIAKQVILNEVRRLQESHTTAKNNSQQLYEKMSDEINKNIQHCLALQSLQTRLTAIERSAHTLRELLHQRLGDQGVLELIESLERLGAGSTVLLETPTTEPVATSSTPSSANVQPGGSKKVNATPPSSSRRKPSSSSNSRPETIDEQSPSEYNKKIDNFIYKR